MSAQRMYSQSQKKKPKGLGLYLKVHVMPQLNKPLHGKAWHWILPVVLIGFSIVVLFYFFG